MRNKLRRVTANEYYKDFYTKVLSSSSVGFVAKMTHKSLETRIMIDESESNIKVLEIGAGHGEHRRYVKHNYSEYWETDIRIEPILDKYSKLDKDKRVKVIELDANNLESIPTQFFDRIILTCVLVHLQNPIQTLQELKRIVRNEGTISMYIPCEPSIVLRLSRYFTTVQTAKKLGVDHLHFHYLEHKFHYLYIKHAIDEVFTRHKVARVRWPFPFLSWGCNLWEVVQIRNLKDS